MGQKHTAGVVLSDHPLTSQEQQLKSKVIRCPETQRITYSCRIPISYCPNPPRYDTSEASNHQEFMRLIDSGSGTGISIINKTFSELEEKLQRRHINPSYVIIPLIFLLVLLNCGMVYLQGLHSPGFYASPQFVQKIGFISFVILLCVLLGLVFNAHYRTKKVEMIVQNHFDDWKELGINVQYQFPQIPRIRWRRNEAQRLQDAGAILITMPSSASIPTPCEPIDSQNIYSSTLPPNYNTLPMEETQMEK